MKTTWRHFQAHSGRLSAYSEVSERNFVCHMQWWRRTAQISDITAMSANNSTPLSTGSRLRNTNNWRRIKRKEAIRTDNRCARFNKTKTLFSLTSRKQRDLRVKCIERRTCYISLCPVHSSLPYNFKWPVWRCSNESKDISVLWYVTPFSRGETIDSEEQVASVCIHLLWRWRQLVLLKCWKCLYAQHVVTSVAPVANGRTCLSDWSYLSKPLSLWTFILSKH